MLRKLTLATAVITLLGCSGKNAPSTAPPSLQGPQPQSTTEDARPNILMILIDDLGYTDLGAFGGNVETPHIDALANTGLRFSNAHAYPACGPTRATLITGKDPHRVGLGSQNGFGPPGVPLTTPGYSGSLEGEYTGIAQVLLDAGYETFQVGKWHLGHEAEQSPRALGFTQNYSLLDGAASHYGDMKTVALRVSESGKAAYEHNGEGIEQLPDDFYSTKDYTDKLLGMLKTRADTQRPFFAYLAYTAVHDPLHAPAALIQKYLSRYESGFRKLRDERIRASVNLGLVAHKHPAIRWLPNTPDWENLTPKQQQDLKQRLAVYAAMIEYLNDQVGKLVDYLKESGEFENTLIVVMSDNGAASAPRMIYPRDEKGLAWQRQAYPLTAIADYGKPGSYPTLSHYNAQAVSGPLFSTKTSVHEGGTRVPLIIKAPNGQRNSVNHTFFHVADLYPTFADYAGADISKQRGLLGDSAKPLIEGRSQHIGSDDFGLEYNGRRAYRSGPWKLVFESPPYGGTGQYALYNLAEDPGETVNLADDYPERVAALATKWNAYASRNGVVPSPMEAVNQKSKKTVAKRLTIDWGD